MYLIRRLQVEVFHAYSLNPYSNGTMYLIMKKIENSFVVSGVLILILMEQCI